jgi:CSLREA domain-containing protein
MRLSQPRAALRLLTFATGLILAAQAAPAQVFNERGFKPNRDFFSQLPFEHIDPLTGNLLLTFTDLVLPGNAGFDLRVQRTYNSKIYRDTTFGTLDEDSWAGVGWTLHFGRVWNGTAAPGSPPVVEMPDGSRHPMFNHVAPPAGCGSCWISRDYWIYDKNTRVLRLPDGRVYTFGRETTINQTPVVYATDIRDPFGNFITVAYDAAESDVITQVVQNLGTQTRTVTFSKHATNRWLTGMTYVAGSRTYQWTYTQQNTQMPGGFSRLEAVQPPAIDTAAGWQFEYFLPPSNPAWELKKVVTPHGGETSYTYAQFESRLGTAQLIPFRGVSTRTTSGGPSGVAPREISAGTWQYAYAETPDKNRTTITSPCGTTQLTFLGVGNAAAEASWKIGLLSARTVSDANTTQSESFTWRTPAFGDRISEDDEIIVVGGNSSTEIYVPLLESRSLTRDGRVYVTSSTYSSTNFNDFGRPNLISENGPDYAGSPDRTTSRTFDYSFTAPLYLKDRVASETVTVGTESFVKTYSYVDANGFKDKETIHGIEHSFTPTTDGRGNVSQAKDESDHATSFTYTSGAVDNTVTPIFTIDRTINLEGTVAAELRRGFTTSFQYDARFRLLTVDRPAGNDTSFTYDNTGVWEFTQVTRGSSWTKTYVDGFGRPTATENSVGVKTDVRHDACGRTVYESYPFEGVFTGPANKGTTYSFDALGRTLSRQHPDGAAVTFAYSDGVGATGIKVRVTNERQKATDQIWKAFGDPDEARLATVVDADLKTWSYTYNALGSITRVTSPGGQPRIWEYYGPSEGDNGHGLLKKETFPENENRVVTYTYHKDGMLKTRDDPAFGVTTFTPDANHRPFTIDRPGTDYDTQIRHDDSDNRTTLNNGHVSSGFTYDGSNRLTQRQDTVAGTTHTTVYTPDGNDNIERIDYPSGLSVTYGYDTENRVTTVRRTTGTCPDASGGGCFAHSFQYHPSGAPTSYRTGNELLHTATYDTNRYWLRSVEAGGHLRLSYRTYDAVGNVVDIDDLSNAAFNQHFAYDDLDRLTTANGPWGTGSFGYDERGNRRSKTIGGQTTTYNYNVVDQFDRLHNATGAEPDGFTYDWAGNLLTQNGRTYTYTPENMLETAAVSGVQTTYRYDGDNLRKQRSTVGGVNRYFIHGPGGQLLVEYEDDCQGTRRPRREYVYAGSRLVASVRHGQQRFVSLTAAAVSPGEAATSVTFTVRVTTSDGLGTACPVTVNFATANGTAQAGSDYTATSGSVSFAAGSDSGATANRTVTLLPDTMDEDNESFTVTLSSPTQAELVNPVTQVITIIDDDNPPSVSVSNCSVNEATGAVVPCAFNVSLSNVSGKPITVTASTQNGTAVAGADYTPRTNVLLTFPPGTGSVPFPVDVIGDALDEPTEGFTAVLTAPVNATPGDMVGDATIVDDDPPAQMSIADATVNDRKAGNVVYLPVTLSTPSGFVITVNFATVANTAAPGVDFLAASGGLTFLPGEVRKLVPVAIVQDAREEGRESFFVDLSGATNVNVVDARGEAFIVERSAPPPACASRLDPTDDQTGIQVDLLLSEVAPTKHIELYNPGPVPIALGSVLHQLNSEPEREALNALGLGVIVPARGYARMPWPSSFSDQTSGGEVILFKNGDFNNSQNMVDFTCWGTNPHASRKAQAEAVGKWAGACAPPLAVDALHRRRGTNGKTAQSYDAVSPSSPMDCVGIFSVTTTADSNDGTCDADCSLREAVIAANAAPGDDAIRLPKGTYAQVAAPAGEDEALGGDLDITDAIWLAGAGARSTSVENSGHFSPDRVFDVHSGAAVTITGLTVSAGHAEDGDGGGVRVAGSLRLREVALKNGAAARGGAVAVVNAGALTLDRVTVSGAHATGEGGALALAGPSCSAALTDTTLSGNTAAGAGGALHVSGGGSVHLRGVTITQNTSDTLGGGVAASSGTITFRNSIVAQNTDWSGQAPDCIGGTLVSEQYNLIGSATGCSFPQGTGDQIGVSAQLGILANNRGPTQTHALLAGSPAIDSGHPGAPGTGGLTCESRDQRSYGRPVDGAAPSGAQCDKGAFELCAPVFSDTGGHFADLSAKELSCRGIAAGCGGTNFCPDNAVTRASMAVFLVAAMDEQPSGVPYNQYFNDIADDAFAKFINRVKELGITGGCGGVSYCPATAVKRQEIAVFLVVALEERPSTAAYNAYFADVPNNGFAPFINRLFELGITSGCGTGPGGERLFCPTADLTRGTMAVWLVASFFTF